MNVYPGDTYVSSLLLDGGRTSYFVVSVIKCLNVLPGYIDSGIPAWDVVCVISRNGTAHVDSFISIDPSEATMFGDGSYWKRVSP